MSSRPTQGAVFWLLRAASVVLLSACGPPDYAFVEEDAGSTPGAGGESGGEPGDSTPTICASDDECAGLSATSLCDTGSGYCVECIPERELELERCPGALYCDPAGHCAVGCATDSDCAGLACDPASHVCTGCQGDLECGAGTRCEDSACVPHCDTADSCPGDWLCCDGQCKNPLTDAGHCAACGSACDDDGECLNGRCGSPRCAAGLAECDGDPVTRCETDVRSDPANCGKCRVTCASGFCSGGTCTTVDCPPGFADCNQEEADRCETDLGSVDDCGACNQACSAQNGTPSCTARGCLISCDDGFDDCDEDVDTGCEARLATDTANCGSCGNACTNEHGSTRCVDGDCTPRCDGGFADCNGDPADGCETSLSDSVADCGACGERCAPTHAEGICMDGVCEARCESGFDDCNGDAEDGCEADLGTPETCGSCTNHCGSNGGTARCDPGGSCSIVCDPDHGDCQNGLLDGCETEINVSARNCGSCGTVCPTDVGMPACYEGICGISTCIDPHAECDSSNTTPCETNVTSNLNHCGACGNACYFPNGTPACVNRACVLMGCTAGYADCTPALGCETVLGTLDDCRSCGEACRNDHGSTACRTTGCAPTCAIGYGDCDASRANGCERSVLTLTDCGTCGVPCAFPNATATCSTGTCSMVGCNPGFGDCGTSPGCETTLGSATSCAFCNNACTNAHGPNVCRGAPGSFDCSPTCDAGWDSCDGNPDNGCETSLTTATHCGVCGRVCTGATPLCQNGACTGAASPCASGSFAFCDDFEDGNANGWTTTGGTWSFAPDPSVVYVGGLGSFRSSAGATTWTNQTVQSKVKILHFDMASSSYRAGIMARFGGSTNYYTFQIDGAGDLRLLRGTSTLSGTGSCAAVTSTLAAGTWYTLKLAVSGPLNNARLVSSFSTNGTTFTPVHDCTLTSSTLDTGSAGVITVGTNTNAEFDDFLVTTP